VVTLKLHASDGKALLIVGMDCHKGKWYCDVFLKTGNDTIMLGGEGFKQIRSWMMSGLRSPHVTKRAVLGDREVDFFGVTNLIGPSHIGSFSSILGVPIKEENPDGSVTVKWVDLLWDGDFRQPIMRLSPKDIQSWLTILESTEQLSEGES
jgi:hypothetical protein